MVVDRRKDSSKAIVIGGEYGNDVDAMSGGTKTAFPVPKSSMAA